MATHSSVLAWRIPGTGEPGGLPSMGSHRVGHEWSDSAAAAACMPAVHKSTCFKEKRDKRKNISTHISQQLPGLNLSSPKREMLKAFREKKKKNRCIVPGSIPTLKMITLQHTVSHLLIQLKHQFVTSKVYLTLTINFKCQEHRRVSFINCLLVWGFVFFFFAKIAQKEITLNSWGCAGKFKQVLEQFKKIHILFKYEPWPKNAMTRAVPAMISRDVPISKQPQWGERKERLQNLPISCCTG